MEEKKALTLKQLKSIPVLLSEPSYEQARAKLGIGQTTLYRWLADENFKRALDQERNKVTNDALSRLKTSLSQAVETLFSIMTQSQSEQARRQASESMIRYAMKGYEIQNINERIERIEKILQEKEIL